MITQKLSQTPYLCALGCYCKLEIQLPKLIFAGIIQYFNNKGETVKVESFSDAFYKPDGLYESGMLDHIFRGMIKSHTQVRILIIKY